MNEKELLWNRFIEKNDLTTVCIKFLEDRAKRI